MSKTYLLKELKTIEDPEIRILSATEQRILDCASESWKIYHECKNHHASVVYGHCFIRYCDFCMDSKKSRNFNRITENYGKYFEKTCKHVILTLPYGRYSKERKGELENAKRKFFQILRRKGMQVRAIAVFDYGNPKSEDPLETNIHIHTAFAARFINYDMLCNAWRRATGNPFAVVRVAENKTKDGKRTTDISTRKVFSYFARRMSGDFGHGHNVVSFLEMGMSTTQYDHLVRGSRVFTWNRDRCGECVKLRKLWKEGKLRSVKRPTCLSCKICAKESQVCPICQEKFETMAVTYCGNFIFCSMDWDPPHNFQDLEDGCIVRKLENDSFKKLPQPNRG